MPYEPIIGIETHVQLATATKLFSRSPNSFGFAPNSNANEIDLGLPGTLPVLNSNAVFMAIKFGLSINASIAKQAIFARKNYFYPDLPKGYQITQHDFPIVENGFLMIDIDDTDQNCRDKETLATERINITSTHNCRGKACLAQKKINIVRAHLEEDAGKLLHENIDDQTAIDFNRAGIPLLEIVSAPDMRSSKEAVCYLKALHTLVRYLKISDANMQEGNFRADVNVSLRSVGQKEFGTRCEIKNLNSFRFVEQAILCEMKRQTDILESGKKVIQETLHFDPEKNLLQPLRKKEDVIDYHYFPDPDLLPLIISTEEIEKARQTLPELPWQKNKRFIQQYGLNKYDVAILTRSIELADYFEAVCQLTKATPKVVANWLISIETQDSGFSNKEQLATLLDRVTEGTISLKIAKEIFLLLDNESDIDQIIAEKQLKQISNEEELTKIIQEVLAAHPNEIKRYRAGKEALFGFFVGQIMKMTENKANPKILNELLQNELNKRHI